MCDYPDIYDMMDSWALRLEIARRHGYEMNVWDWDKNKVRPLTDEDLQPGSVPPDLHMDIFPDWHHELNAAFDLINPYMYLEISSHGGNGDGKWFVDAVVKEAYADDDSPMGIAEVEGRGSMMAARAICIAYLRMLDKLKVNETANV